MHTLENRWDLERAAAWLRRHGWGDAGEEQAPPPAPQLEADPAQAGTGAAADEEIDIAGWPALVAPFYD